MKYLPYCGQGFWPPNPTRRPGYILLNSCKPVCQCCTERCTKTISKTPFNSQHTAAVTFPTNITNLNYFLRSRDRVFHVRMVCLRGHSSECTFHSVSVFEKHLNICKHVNPFIMSLFSYCTRVSVSTQFVSPYFRQVVSNVQIPC